MDTDDIVKACQCAVLFAFAHVCGDFVWCVVVYSFS